VLDEGELLVARPAITSEIYGHLDLDDMRKAVNKLSFKPTGSSTLKLVR
jgi:hypothetical protein